MTETVQQQIDKVVEEFRKQLENIHMADDIETTGTQVRVINFDLETSIADLKYFRSGTLLNCGGWEAFRFVNNNQEYAWMTFNGEQLSDEQLADLMRHNGSNVMVIHEGQ